MLPIKGLQTVFSLSTSKFVAMGFGFPWRKNTIFEIKTITNYKCFQSAMSKALLIRKLMLFLLSLRQHVFSECVVSCLVSQISFVKQFVVTNCSKERPVSIVTKTIKNWILISIATSKESHFNADFKYISFIKFSLTHQRLRAWENLPYLRK